MAKNRHFANGRQLALAATDPAVPASGDPVIIGQLAGVALENERADGLCSIDTQGVYDLSVKGVVTGTGNVAVAIGDLIYYNSGDTPKLNKTTTGVKFGVALATITSGSTATIAVKLVGP